MKRMNRQPVRTNIPCHGSPTFSSTWTFAFTLSCICVLFATNSTFAFQEETPRTGSADASSANEESPETATGIIYPIDVAADSTGAIYVADRQLPGIWKVTDGKPEIFFQASKKFRTPLNAVRCLAVGSDDKLYAGCSTTTEIYRFDETQPVALTKGMVSVPMNLVVDGDSIYVCDLKMRLLDRVPTAGGELQELAEIQAAKAVTAAPDGLLVLTGIENPILQISRDGKQRTPVVTGRPFNYPADMVRMADGTLVVSDSYEKCLWKIVEGKVEKWITDERFSNPVGICLAGDDIILADSRANMIFRIQPDGTVEVVCQGQPTP